MPEPKQTPESDASSEKLVEHLRQKWGDPRNCPMCGAAKWHVGDTVFTPVLFTGGGVRIGGPSIPMVPVVCTDCGFTAWINALVAKLIEPDKGDQK